MRRIVTEYLSYADIQALRNCCIALHDFTKDLRLTWLVFPGPRRPYFNCAVSLFVHWATYNGDGHRLSAVCTYYCDGMVLNVALCMYVCMYAVEFTVVHIYFTVEILFSGFCILTMFVCIYVSMYVRTHVCMHVCMCMCMYICSYFIRSIYI